MHPHEKLDVWNKGIELAETIYSITKRFPKDELYGLTSQLRRAAVSIPANIAEGAARHSKAEFKQFLYIARGSLSELETEVRIAVGLDYMSDADYKMVYEKCCDTGAMLTGLIKVL